MTLPNQNPRQNDRRERVNKIIELPAAKPEEQIAELASEQAVLGAVLQRDDVYPVLSDMLEPGDFFILWHGYVWLAFEKIAARGERIDIITVDAELERMDQGNMDRLATLFSAAPITDNAEAYAARVREAATLLRVEQATDKMKGLIRDKASRGELESVIDQCNAWLFEATDQRQLNDTSVRGAVNRYADRVESSLEGGNPRTLFTGFHRLDAMIGGLAPGEVAVLAGNDGMGKTAMTLSMMRNILQTGRRVVFFPLEMSQDEVVSTLIAMESGLSKDVLRSMTLRTPEISRFTHAAGVVGNYPLDIIDEFPDMNPLQMRRKLRKISVNQPIDLVVIDGLWLMTSDSTSEKRYEDVGKIMTALTKQARYFHVPILITHQYSSAAHTRSQKDKTPKTSDLAESAAVRRTAQLILGLHRDSYYGIEDELDHTQLHCLKNRNGVFKRDFVNFTFNNTFARYQEA